MKMNMKKNLKNFLSEEVGLYSLYINFKSSFFHRFSFTKNGPQRKKKVIEKIISSILFAIRTLTLNTISQKDKHSETDILFISRYRPKPNTKGKRDYLFDTVIKFIGKNYDSGVLTNSLNNKRYSHDESKDYNILDNLNIWIMVKSINKSLKLYLKYKIFKLKWIRFHTLLIICTKNFCLEEYLKTLKPKIVVVNEDTTYKVKPKSYEGKWIVVQSAHRSLKSHKFQKDWYSEFVTEKEKTDSLCVSGPYFEHIYRKYFPHAKNIVVTGQPRFDHLIKNKNQESKMKIKNQDSSNKKILWGTQTHGLTKKENKKNLIAMREILENISDINLFIKLHPAERQKGTIYDPLEKKYENCLIINNEHELSNLSDLLSLCDIFITKKSTAAIEASLMDKDIIIADYIEKSKNRYIQHGIAIGAYDPKEVKKKIRKLSNDDELKEKLSNQRKKLNYEYNYLNDGKASERIAEIIEREIESISSQN